MSQNKRDIGQMEERISLDTRTATEPVGAAAMSKVESSQYGDEALKALMLEGGNRAVIDDATNRRLKRRIGDYLFKLDVGANQEGIDLCLMPLMCFTYFIQLSGD